MNNKAFRDERGVAMVLELVLVAVVVGLVGVAVYQGAHHAKSLSSTAKPAATVNTPQGLAASAAAIAQTESTTDAGLSAGGDAAATEVSSTDADMANLGGSIDANAF